MPRTPKHPDDLEPDLGDHPSRHHAVFSLLSTDESHPTNARYLAHLARNAYQLDAETTEAMLDDLVDLGYADRDRHDRYWATVETLPDGIEA